MLVYKKDTLSAVSTPTQHTKCLFNFLHEKNKLLGNPNKGANYIASESENIGKNSKQPFF